MLPDMLVDLCRSPALFRISIIVLAPLCIFPDVIPVFVLQRHHDQLEAIAGQLFDDNVVQHCVGTQYYRRWQV